MSYQITEVEFDFTDEDHEGPVSASIQALVRNKVVGKVYHVEHLDHLAEVVSDDSGWCVLSLSYVTLDSTLM